MLKKPLAHIVFLALLMNRNMLQPLLIETWSAKVHVMLLQVQSVLVTTHMMQFYTRWLYCLDDSIEICQFGTNFYTLQILQLNYHEVLLVNVIEVILRPPGQHGLYAQKTEGPPSVFHDCMAAINQWDTMYGWYI